MQAIRLFTLLVLCGVAAGNARADIIPIDLNDFFADPEVTVSGDGSTASFTESVSFFSTLFSNDPGLGDPEVIIAAVGTMLLFDFDFLEAAGEDDEFFAAVLDSTGFSAGAAFDFLTGDSSTGTVAFDLSSLVAEPFIGFQFELVSFDGGGSSTLTVSNLRLVTPMVEVPEPPALFLMLAGLLAMTGTTRRGRHKTAST